jgi:hypothetical protein
MDVEKVRNSLAWRLNRFRFCLAALCPLLAPHTDRITLVPPHSLIANRTILISSSSSYSLSLMSISGRFFVPNVNLLRRLKSPASEAESVMNCDASWPDSTFPYGVLCN